jgi:RNA polymerase sigma-70 factor, ECF subfamily
MGDLDDGELARRIAGAAPGEARAAEAELVARFAPRIRLYGLRHLRDAEAARDLAQEVLVTTLESLRAGRVREPERLASFVLGTCRMTVANQRRGERRRMRLLAEQGDVLVPAPEPEPGAASSLDGERLAECVGRLAPRERTVVALTFYAERSGEEIARELGTSAGNVRVLRHRVLARLHECLEVSR